ncbi:MAG TPA: glycosyltransferase family 4 protein [Acidimicrobiia bacterium]|nr:glycosyltransferase family 4 protein [Acidimicrobiia bacterium]
MSIRLLVVSERSDRTGSVALLVTLLEGLRAHIDVRLTVVLGSEGELLDRFAELADDLVVARPGTRRARTAARVSRTLGLPSRSGRQSALYSRLESPDVVYVSSLLTAPLVEGVDSRRTILHVNEVQYPDGETAAVRTLIQRSSLLAVVSNTVAAWMADTVRAPADRIRLIPGAVGPSAFILPERDAVSSLGRDLGIPDDALVVSSVGWLGRQKGSDRFLDVASEVRDRLGPQRPVRFVWAGAGEGSSVRAFRAEIDRRSLADTVIVLASVADPRPLYRVSDAVMVPSRAEALSLVALEAAAQRRSVVCFPGSGGPEELAGHGVASTCAAPRSDSMTQLLIELADDPARRQALGEHASQVVQTRYAADRSQRLLAQAIEEVAAARIEP